MLNIYLICVHQIILTLLTRTDELLSELEQE